MVNSPNKPTSQASGTASNKPKAPISQSEATASPADAQEEAPVAAQGNRSANGMAEIEKLSENCNLDRWLDRFEIAARFFNWTAAGKAGVLLLKTAPTLYDKLADYVCPNKPGEMSFESLTEALQELLIPTTYVLAERFSFQKLGREPTESVRAFAERLTKAAEKCEFENRDVRMRDQFICGLGSQAIVGKLIIKDHKKLTFKEAVAEAEAHSSLLETQIMKTAPKSDSGTVLKVSMRRPISKPKEVKTPTVSDRLCKKCAGTHEKFKCPAFGKTCNRCGKANHFAKACKSPEFLQKKAGGSGKPAVQHVRESSGVFIAEVQNCSQVQDHRQPISITVFVIEGLKRHALKCELDTGAGVSIMSESLWQQLGRPALKKSNTQLGGYVSDHKFTVLGRYEALVELEGKYHHINFEIVKGSKNYALLGRDVLTVQLGTGREVSVSMNAAYQEASPTAMRAHLELKVGAVPRYVKARPLPFAQCAAVKAELDRLLEEEIIEAVKFSDWASPIVVVSKPNGESDCALIIKIH